MPVLPSGFAGSQRSSIQAVPDPVGSLDHATIITGSAFYGATLVLIVYAWFNRLYQPIRAKNLPLTTLAFVCGALWFVGDFAAYGSVPAASSPWHLCKFWALWIQLAFSCLFLSTLLVRVYTLHWLFVRRRQLIGWRPYAPFAGLLLGLVAFCLGGQLGPESTTIGFDQGTCVHARTYRACSLALLWMVWLANAAFMWQIRKIQSSFSKVRESLAIALVMLVALLQNTIAESVHHPVPLHQKARAANTWTDFIAANAIIWIILAYDSVQSLVNRQEYLTRWRMDLVNEGFRREYNTAGTDIEDLTTHDTSMGPQKRLSMYSSGNPDSRPGTSYTKDTLCVCPMVPPVPKELPVAYMGRGSFIGRASEPMGSASSNPSQSRGKQASSAVVL